MSVLGAVRSILMPLTVVGAGLPARSDTDEVADRLSPSPLIVEFAGQSPSAMPDSASLHVQETATSPLYQPLLFGPVVGAPLIVGAVRSIFRCGTDAVAVLPAMSLTETGPAVRSLP